MSFQPPRKLRVFSFDPSTGNRHANRSIRELLISIPWELDPEVKIGPDGEYLQIVDYDPASGFFYGPLDLDNAEVRYGCGLKPSEENPQFHQQMVYAVCMSTIAVFEQVLGRRVLWSPRPWTVGEGRRFVRQLRIYPHALREANAYYDSNKKALLFGYFTADETSTSAPPGATLFTCLSHDIIVHEVCHAILDGMHPHFIENTNPDMLALHEAFADIVAIFQHFSHPEVLEDQIARARGDLERESLLGSLAQEFGEALGYNGALRDALGSKVDGKWVPRMPDNQVLQRLESPHARGAILVAAVFRAFLSIYKSRVADLFRIASGGSGILRDGEIYPDLVKRLANEAATSARHVLRMCIRALDYVPPVDVDFGDYLRAIITADHDLYPEDEQDYRLAVIEAFSAWGIYAKDTPIITERSLLWPSLHDTAADLAPPGSVNALEEDFGMLIAHPDDMLEEMRKRGDMLDYAGSKVLGRLEQIKNLIADRLNDKIEQAVKSKSDGRLAPRTVPRFTKDDVLKRNLLANEFENDRHVTYLAREFYAQLFWGIITAKWDPNLMQIIGLTTEPHAPKTIKTSEITKLPSIQVHSVRMATRIGKRGQQEKEYVVELIQSRDGYFDTKIQSFMDDGKEPEALRRWRKLYGDREFKRDFRYRCGSTLLIDTKSYEIRRVIRTRFHADEDEGLDRLRQYLAKKERHARNAFDDPADKAGAPNAFASLHRNVERGSF